MPLQVRLIVRVAVVLGCVVSAVMSLPSEPARAAVYLTCGLAFARALKCGLRQPPRSVTDRGGRRYS